MGEERQEERWALLLHPFAEQRRVSLLVRPFCACKSARLVERLSLQKAMQLEPAA
jgi:hypothetical protein